MGVFQSVEVLKYLTGIGKPLINKMLLFDALKMDINILDIIKDPNCSLCGCNASIQTLQNNELHCKNKRLLKK